MRNLGPAIIDYCQQREIERGVRSLLIGRDRVFPDAADRAVVGDLFWVKEPHFEVKSRQKGPQHIHEFVPGSPTGATFPDHLKPHLHKLRLIPQRPAAALNKGDSRACMCIRTVEPSGFRCEIIMQNINNYLSAQAAA
jgi:hypothetical protein